MIDEWPLPFEDPGCAGASADKHVAINQENAYARRYGDLLPSPLLDDVVAASRQLSDFRFQRMRD